MGVYPYITAQIILQLLIPIIPALQRRMQEDPREGRQWMERWTYFLAVPMAVLSAIGQINIFNSLSVQALNKVIVPFGFSSDLWLPSLTILLAMTAGTMFAIWLCELISEYGIRGQGLSLVIFSGIVARMPNNLLSLLSGSVRALVLVETALRPQLAGGERAALLDALEHDYPGTLRANYAAFGRDSAQGAALYAHAAGLDSSAMKAWIRLAVTADLSAAVAALRVPTLAVFSERSWPASEDWPACAETLGYARLRGVTPVRVERVGHFVMLDRPALLAGIIRRFERGLRAPSLAAVVN